MNEAKKIYGALVGRKGGVWRARRGPVNIKEKKKKTVISTKQ